jgi:hypothetical protein
LSSGHRVIDITNGHFIHAGPLEGIGVSIYLFYLIEEGEHIQETSTKAAVAKDDKTIKADVD